MEIVSVGEAKNRFSELISRAAAGERFLIQPVGQPAVLLVSAAELEYREQPVFDATRLARELGQSEALLKSIEAGELHPAMAAFGLWGNEPDLDTLTSEIYTNRERQVSRPSISL
jgi:prevent-host-death family protein